MRIALTYENGEVFQHFGRTEQFKIYDVENKEVTASQILPCNGEGHGALAGLLKQADVDVLICGGIGMGARMALEEAGISLIPGAEGNADETVRSFLQGTLDFDLDAMCDHHGHEHGCHEEDHECQGGCCH
ncbi:MAG: NifB/NifX family molybdenum-iron cluster-binding protein [Erysipelotrichaceae bacterium]|nr:NifB/NifX family molybdenum-iron cluster-binding protein [Erysipelotrichaceae bacterium]